MEKKMVKVCVTGGSSYVGSSLVKELLERGYTVHATLRNMGETSKVGLLKYLPFADSRLVLFQADIYNPHEFAPAIQGCQTVVHVATPLIHDSQSSQVLFPDPSSEKIIRATYRFGRQPTRLKGFLSPWVIQYKNTSEAGVAGVRCIVDSCIKSGTVKRLVYTASVVAASTLKDDGSGYKLTMDETCWTSLNLSYPYANDFLTAYVHSKTLAEKEALRCNDGKKIEVVSLVCGLIGGDTIQSWLSESLKVILSQVCKDETMYQVLRFLEELIGKVPIVHIEDVATAFMCCIETTALTGRVLCAADFLTSAEIASILQGCCPDIKIPDRFIEDSKREIRFGSSKLEELGFQYKYDAKMIIESTLQCFKKFQENV